MIGTPRAQCVTQLLQVIQDRFGMAIELCRRAFILGVLHLTLLHRPLPCFSLPPPHPHAQRSLTST